MKYYFSILAVTLLIAFQTGCDKDDPKILSAGQVTFSFQRSVTDPSNGRQRDQAAPAFVSYTVKKSDGSMISNKIALYEFSGSFVTQAEQLLPGHYTLEQFLILDNGDHTIYASPLAGSELADLVEHPLPLSFDIMAEEVTSVVPEVLALANHTPEEFGYVAFGFTVVDKFDFTVSVTIADNLPHTSINYVLEIIAKDSALGNVQWTKTIAMSALGTIHFPAKYAHYTFRAIKEGYIPHVYHILKADLAQLNHLAFEFLPEALSDFIVREQGGATVYMAKNPCKLYARVDMREGYRLSYFSVDKSAVDHIQSINEVADRRVSECVSFSQCIVRVNLFDNIPYTIAEDYCAMVDLSRSSLDITMNDVFYESFFYVDSEPYFFSDAYTWWTQGNFGGPDL